MRSVLTQRPSLVGRLVRALLIACLTASCGGTTPHSAESTQGRSAAATLPTSTAMPSATPRAVASPRAAGSPTPWPTPPEVPTLAHPAGIEVEVKESEYVITGSTVDELREAMRGQALEDDSGARQGTLQALTSWYVTWLFAYEEGSNGCHLTGVDVSVDVNMLMPRWDPPATAPADLVGRWRYFSAALLRHEHVHAQNGFDTAAEVAAALAEIQPRRTCRGLEKAANAAAEAITKAGAERDHVYDLETGHGVSEGASF